MESEPVSWIIFVCVLAPSVTFAVNFSRIMWIEVLKVVAGKSATAFRYLTCGTKEITAFKLQYMDENSDDEGSIDEEGDTNTGTKNKSLLGFRAKTVDHSKQMLEALEKEEKRKEKEAAFDKNILTSQGSEDSNAAQVRREMNKIMLKKVAR